MSDPRFFKNSGPFTLEDINKFLGTELSNNGVSNDYLVADIATLSNAKEGNITFFQDLKYKDDLLITKASVCILKKEHSDYAPKNLYLIYSENPYMDFTKISQKFYPFEVLPKSTTGVNSQDSFDESVELGKDVIIEKGAVIGKNVIIGDKTTISSNSVIGIGVKIGSDCYIGSNVNITHSIIGDNNIIHQGTSIGQDGFGFSMSPEKHEKIPQVGRVIIENNIEIGSNCSIDRGSLQDTIIKNGTKIDNLVHIAHNCVIGENCIIAGMVGLAGSTTLEDFVVMGAKSGAVGHIIIGKGSQIAAKAGVSKSLPPGKIWAGFPIREIDTWRKEVSMLRRAMKDKKNDKK